MTNVNELKAVEEKEVIQIESKDFNFPLYDGFNEELCDSEGNRVTRQALEFIVEDNQSGDLDRVISDMVDRYSSDSTYDIWTMMRDARDAFQDAISEGMVVVNPDDMNNTMLNAYLYLLDSELQANRSEILYNYIVYRVNKMLVDKHVTQMDIEGLEQEIENYADEAESSYSEFDYMDDEMFSQLEEFIDSYMAGLEMGQPLDNQDYENIGDVTITEGAIFVKKDETTRDSYYVVRVCGNEFDGFHVENMYVDLSADWFNVSDTLHSFGLDEDNYDAYDFIQALIGYYGCEEFQAEVINCKTAVDLCGALRNIGVNVVWSAEHNEIQF
ncbi:hypothetical protein DIGNKC_262 [Bacillus phage DIGNKC]|uniref:hypothetical protein n=1 Tax=Bacillus phage DIGNKC TaxID=1805948 RepID=UPI0007A76FF0|nr:hypothetical protein BI007_gp112 [Bacillus phage DIGNKC]AMW62783.1 hypothetical protein DIGNKC_262 [Bacillus phage DIGNKC]